MTPKKPTNTDLRPGEEAFTDDDKGSLPATTVNETRKNPDYIPDSWDDAIQYLQETGEVVEFEGSPWHPVDKKHLVGKPFIIMGWAEQNGDRGPYTSLFAICQEPVPDDNGTFRNRVVINDGGTGIHSQWSTVVASGKAKVGLLCKNGLRVSEYDHPDFGPSKTYYLG
jgi:hypothetical protein